MSPPPLFISIPAWGEFYVGLACKYTIPAVIASLKQSDFTDVTFLINCGRDEQDQYRQTIGDYKIEFPGVQSTPHLPNGGRVPRLHDDHWRAFKKAHKDAIGRTPRGGIVALLNSDIVCSRETFSYVDSEMGKGSKVVASVGIRTSDEDRTTEPPIGASADELFKWIWGNLHHISKECRWNGGRSQHPTILFFEDDHGVVMRGWHLTPMFIKVDRFLPFKGTIDDDLLGRFNDDEVSYPHNGEIAFAEISPNIKRHNFGTPITVDNVAQFWARRALRSHYLRNFKQRLRVLGSPIGDHPAVEQIIAKVGEAH